jgi:hypothetical protein
LASDLQQIDHEPFFDKQLTGGHPWWEELLARIRNCDLFIPVLSAHYLDSKPCSLEAQYAHDLNKPFLPIAIEPVSASLFYSYIAETQWLHYGSADKNAVFDLVRALKNVPPCPPLPDPLPARPAVPVSDFTPEREQIESPEKLSHAQQSNLSNKLRGRLDGPDGPAARTLLEKLAKRPDVVPAVAADVNRALGMPTTERARRRAETPARDDAHDHRTRNRLFVLVAVIVGLLGVGAAALAVTAGGGKSSNNRPTPATSAVSVPVSTAGPQWVVTPESCGALNYGADGSAGPITCPDGRPNAAAVTYYEKGGFKLLGLGANASPVDVTNAICADLRGNVTTNVIEQEVYNLMAAGMDWHFGLDPSSVIQNGGCTSS